MKIHGGIKVGTMARIRNVPGTMAVAAPRVIIPARCHGRLKKPLECNQPHSSCHSLLASLEGALGERVPCLQGVLTRRNIAIPSDGFDGWKANTTPPPFINGFNCAKSSIFETLVRVGSNKGE